MPAKHQSISHKSRRSPSFTSPFTPSVLALPFPFAMVVQEVETSWEPPPPDPFLVLEHFVFPSTKEMALVVRNPRAWQPANETADDSKRGPIHRRRTLRADTDTGAVDHSLLELCLTSSKGLGLFATKDITAGTCLLSETPLVVLPSRECSYHDLQLQLLKLQPHQLDLFHSLCANSASSSPAAKRSIEKSISAEARITRRPLRDAYHLQMEARKLATFVLPCCLLGHHPYFSQRLTASLQLQSQRNAHVTSCRVWYLSTVQSRQPRLHTQCIRTNAPHCAPIHAGSD